MPLFLDVRVGDMVSIDNDRVKVTLREKSGQRARLEIDADKSIPIEHRKPDHHPARNGIKRSVFVG